MTDTAYSTRKVAFVGGPDVNVRIDLMNHLGGDFDTLALGSDPALAQRFDQDDIAYYAYPMARRINPWKDLRGLMRLFWIFRQEKPAVVHAFNTKPSVLARLAAKLAGVSVIVGTPAGFGTLYLNDQLPTRVGRTLYETLQKLASHLSDFTIFQNDYEREVFVKRNITPEDKSGVIPGSGVRTDTFSAEAVSPEATAALRTELGIGPDTIVITLVSRLLRGKGILEFAEAARAIHQQHSDILFLLVGPEDLEGGDALDKAEIDNLAPAVTWIGARSDIPVILAVSDIFVLPSAYAEGIPRVLLEAAAMSLPLVTTSSPGCIDVVNDSVNGFIIPPENAPALTEALRKLITNPALRQQFGQAARDYVVNRFDLRHIASATRELYERLLAQKRTQ